MFWFGDAAGVKEVGQHSNVRKIPENAKGMIRLDLRVRGHATNDGCHFAEKMNALAGRSSRWTILKARFVPIASPLPGLLPGEE